jgi:hypothetical protein
MRKQLTGWRGWCLCFVGLHELDGDCNGWTGDEWITCRRCMRIKLGTLYIWDNKLRKAGFLETIKYAQGRVML